MATKQHNAPYIAAQAEPLWRNALIGIGIFGAALLALFWGTFSDMMRVWAASPTYNHGFIIFPISTFLIWKRRHLLREAGPGLSFWPVAPLLAGLALMAGGVKLDIQLFQHAAFVLILVSGIIALIGADRARLITFPLLFLFFMVPFGDELIPYLQNITTWFIVSIVTLLHIPIYQDGMHLMGPSGDFEVAEACAGLRFLVATIMVSVLFTQLSFNSWRKKIIFMTVAFVVPILANAIRATLIVLIATWSDHQYAVGFDHLVYGWGFFAFIIAGLLLAGNRYADAVIQAPALPEKLTLVASSQRQLWITIALVALMGVTKIAI